MIEFKEGERSVDVSEVVPGLCALTIRRCEVLHNASFYIDKDLYHLLQQAMPHIGAIVEGE